MSKINAVRSEMQSKFGTDLQQFKKDITHCLETEIATAVKTSVATALEGIHAIMNQMLSANNKIIYDNMKSERVIITNATAVAVAKRVDIGVTEAVARALASHAESNPVSPTRKKRSTPYDDAVMEKRAQSSCHEVHRSINHSADGTLPNLPSGTKSSRPHQPVSTI
jgi:hypothetical protein